MPGVWFWLFCLAVILMIVFVVLIEILGPRWYNWLILGVGLIVFFLAFGAYLVTCRRNVAVETIYVEKAKNPEKKKQKELSKTESKNEYRNVRQYESPISSSSKAKIPLYRTTVIED